MLCLVHFIHYEIKATVGKNLIINKLIKIWEQDVFVVKIFHNQYYYFARDFILLPI